MPSPADDPRDARRWLVYARANLLHAEAGHAGGVLLEYLCFDAQQAAEKALKAVLIVRNIDVPRTHDIKELLTLLVEAGGEAPERLKEAVALTSFAVQARYPGWGESLDDDDFAKALALARGVVDWAAQIIEASLPPE